MADDISAMLGNLAAIKNGDDPRVKPGPEPEDELDYVIYRGYNGIGCEPACPTCAQPPREIAADANGRYYVVECGVCDDE